MDKIIKLQSRQGGSWVGGDVSNNLVDWDIPNDGVYDLSRSYINLVVNVTDPAVNVANAQGQTWLPQRGQERYAATVANAVVGATPVLVPTLAWVKDWEQSPSDTVRSQVRIYNPAIVKNCSISSEQVGMLEDIRRSDVLRQNLLNYTLNEDQKKSLEYSSLQQLQDVDDASRSILAELNAGGVKDEALCTLKSRLVKDCRIPIKLNELFEVANMTKYPANKMGKTRVHTELNLDKLKVIYRRQNAQLEENTDGYNSIGASAAMVNAFKLQKTAVLIADLGLNNNVNEVTTAMPEIKEMPYYVGQLVRVNAARAAANGVGTNAENLVQNFAIANTVQNGTIITPRVDPSGGTHGHYNFYHLNAVRVVLTPAWTVPNDAKFKVTIRGYANGLPVQEVIDLSGVTNGTRVFGDLLYEEFLPAAPGDAYKAPFVYSIEGGKNPGNNYLDIGYDEGVIRSNAVITSISQDNAAANGQYTIKFQNILGDLTGIAAITEIAGKSYIDLGGTFPQATDGSPVSGSFQIDTAELVLRKLAKPGKVPNKLEYMTFSTEQFTGSGQVNFQRMFQLEPECANVMIMFPDEYDDLNSSPQDNYVGATNGAGVDQFRLRLDNQDLINRQCTPYSPLYYDRLSMTFLNMGKKLNNMHEWAERFWVGPENDPSSDIQVGYASTWDRTGNNNNGQWLPTAFVNPLHAGSGWLNIPVNGAKPLLIVSNPIPMGKMEKQLQVNLDCSGNKRVANAAAATGYDLKPFGINQLILFKQVMRTVG